MSKEELLKQFIPLKSKKEILDFFKLSEKEIASCTIWTRDHVQLFFSHITDLNLDQDTFITFCPEELNIDAFQKALHDQKNKETYFTVQLKKWNLFFKTDFLSYESNGLVFKIPLVLFKVQRRKHMRVTIPSMYPIKISFPDPIQKESFIEKKAYDISLGGLSFLISKEEKSKFVPFQKLVPFQLSFAKGKCTCEAEIRHLSAQEKNTFLVGIEFFKIDPDTFKVLETFLEELTRRSFSNLF